MRKRVIPLLALFLMLAIMPANVAAHTADEPLVIELIAGGGNIASAVDVGEVRVWNDGENLYVEFVTEDGWCLLETHLSVAENLDGIPQTKKHNPIPGHFEYSSTHLFEDCETEMLYTIPLSWAYLTEIHIAAHAVVAHTITVCAVSEPGVDVFGPAAQYYPLGDSGWGASNPAAATWVHPSWPSIPDATWISTAYHVEDPEGDSWRMFHAETYLPEEDYALSGSVMLATSDNAEEFYFNGVLVGTDGEVQGPFIDDHEWNTIIEYPVTPVPGMNSIDFIVRNYPQAGGVETSNPTGLVYKACFDCYREETAWGAGFDFEGKNWATYFKYTIQDHLCSVVLQPVDGSQVIIAQTLISDLGDLDLSGPVNIMVSYPYDGGPSYFPTLSIDTNGDYNPDHFFEGWCVDTQHTIGAGTWYTVNVYTCGDDLTGVVDKPENKGIVDFILSQDYVGKPSECDGDFTFGDVQRAIWTVIDDDLSTSGLYSWSQCRVDEILADAGWLILTP